MEYACDEDCTRFAAFKAYVELTGINNFVKFDNVDLRWCGVRDLDSLSVFIIDSEYVAEKENYLDNGREWLEKGYVIEHNGYYFFNDDKGFNWNTINKLFPAA